MLSVLASYKIAHKRQVLTSDIDYFNRFVCTGSADGDIQIVDTIEPDKHPPIQLQDHVGSVFQVMFSHPKFGFLASCGSDGKLILRKTNKLNEWKVVYKYDGHKLSTTSIDWAPQKSGAIIGCSSADGTISIHALNSNEWSVSKIPNAHLNGVNCISWASYLINDQLLLVSGGNDNKIKIWQNQNCTWTVKYESDNQLASIKDISWSPNFGLEKYMIASCTADGRVVVWGSDDCYDWSQTEIDNTEKQKQKISWSRFGNVLAVSMNNYFVKLWKQVDKQSWLCLDRQIIEKQQDSEHLNQSIADQDMFSGIV